MRLATTKQDTNDKYNDSETTAEINKVEDKSNEQTNKASSLSLRDVILNKDDNVILVLGSESSGMTNSFKDVTSHNIFIPPQLDDKLVSKAPYNIIDSLNVGVSAGIIINHLKSQLIKTVVESKSSLNNNNFKI